MGMHFSAYVRCKAFPIDHIVTSQHRKDDHAKLLPVPSHCLAVQRGETAYAKLNMLSLECNPN